MSVMTLKRYQEEVCGEGCPDGGYWNRVDYCLHNKAEPEDWDKAGQPLYSVGDLLNAENAAKKLFDS